MSKKIIPVLALATVSTPLITQLLLPLFITTISSPSLPLYPGISSSPLSSNCAKPCLAPYAKLPTPPTTSGSPRQISSQGKSKMFSCGTEVH